MLILTRKQDETVVFELDAGTERIQFEVKILHCHPSRVRLGIAAPKSVKVLRGELLDANEDEQNRHVRNT